MKKTMLKRSLALGALMAFAITGSALAENEIIPAPNVNQNGGNDYKFVALFVNNNEEITKEADTLTFESANKATNNSSATPGTGHNAAVVTGESKLTINVIDLNIGTNENGGGDRGIRLVGDNNKLVINAKNIVAYVGDEFIHVRAKDKSGVDATNSTATVITETFYGKTGWGKDDYGVSLLQANEGGTINFTATKSAILDGSTNDAGGVIGTGGFGTVNVNAKDLTINGNICGSYGLRSKDTGKVALFNITADTLNMSGNINVGSLGNGYSNFSRNTEVNLHVTEKAYINGDVVVVGNSGKNANASDQSLVNITFDGDSVIDGDIIVKGSDVTQDATINLGGTGDMTASKGAYQVTKGGNLNFTGGTWAVNDWQGEDGDLGVGEGATVVINDNITVATASLDDGSTVVIDAKNDKFQNDAVITAGVATVDKGATVQVNNVDTNTAIRVFDDNDVNAQLVDNENIKSDNLMQAFKVDENGDIVVVTANANKVLPGIILSSIVTHLTENNIKNSFFDKTLKSGAKEQAVKAINNAASMSELAGVSHATYSASNILTNAVADHMSLAKGLDHDTDIWAHYVHTKENIDGLAAANSGAVYDAQYNGIVVGADLYKQGKGTIGAALTYIDGKVTGSTKNEAEYYGLSIYGGVQNEDSAVIGDISYLHGKNEITQNNSGYTLTGEPKSDAFSVGVRAEQSFKAGAGKVVPYAGLRYMHLGTGNYTNSIGLSYDADDANLFLLPVGVKYSAEHKSAGWTLRPIVEIGYVWAMGDRDSQQTVSLNGASNGFGYDITDSGSYIGRFALEAEKANVTYGLGYEYQKGDSVKANKWMVNLNWNF